MNSNNNISAKRNRLIELTIKYGEQTRRKIKVPHFGVAKTAYHDNISGINYRDSLEHLGGNKYLTKIHKLGWALADAHRKELNNLLMELEAGVVDVPTGDDDI